MLSLCDADLKGDIFGGTTYPLHLTVIAFILVKLWRGDLITPPYPP